MSNIAPISRKYIEIGGGGSYFATGEPTGHNGGSQLTLGEVIGGIDLIVVEESESLH